MAPELIEGTFVGKQPQTVTDPLAPTHETCWIWKPTAATEFWILYRGPHFAHPYVEPGVGNPDVWLQIEHLGGPELFMDVAEFTAWVLARLLAQGRPNGPQDIEVRVHTVT